MKRRLSTGVKLNVICNGNVIESKSNVTYLGVTLDQFLSREIIASNILYKSSNKLKFLYRNAGKFNLETKKTVDICFDSLSFWIHLLSLVKRIVEEIEMQNAMYPE